MALHTRYEAPTLSISYDYAHDWLYLDWHGALDDDAVMAGGLQLLKQQHRSKVLDNNERTAGLWADAAKWGSDAMLPLLHEAGCRHLAWVYSPERYSQLSAQLAVEHTTAGNTTLTFQDLDTASGWLRRM